MTDAELQKRLNKLVKLCNEVSMEIKVRYPDGFLFYESGGRFYVMDGDDGCGSAGSRQNHVAFESEDTCRGMDCGAW